MPDAPVPGDRGGDGLSIVELALDQLECAMFGLLDQNMGRRGVSLRLVRQARQQYAIRRRRDALLDGLSGEPAWDMLLELFISGAEGRKTPVKNLCLAACTSVSTAMRRLDSLVASGLVRKSDDATDARRSLVELTDRGWAIMIALLQPAP